MTLGQRRTVHDLELVSTQSTRRLLEQAIPRLERRLNVKVSARYIGMSVLSKQGTRDISADIFVGPSEAVDQYLSERPTLPASRVQVAVSRSGAAFRADGNTPQIRTAEQLVACLKAAAAVAYSDGISGAHLVDALRPYGLGEALARKRVLPEPGGSAATCVALGLADIGIQQISEMIASEGVTIVELPEAFRKIAVYDAAGTAREGRADAVAAFLRYLTSREVRESLVGYGLRAPADLAEPQATQ